MRYAAFALAAASGTLAKGDERRSNDSDCQATFKSCLVGGDTFYTCQCNLAQCTGSTDEGIKQYCASGTVIGPQASSSGSQAQSYATSGSLSNTIAPATSSSFALAPSCSMSVPSSSSVAGAQGVQGSTVPFSARPGSIGLGMPCFNNAQCENGAQCWGNQNVQIRRCGNTNAHCTTDAHCAFNTCNQGMCNGYLSGAQSASSSRPIGVSPTGVVPGAARNGTGPVAPFQGSGSVSGIMSGFAAILFGVIAWVL